MLKGMQAFNGSFAVIKRWLKAVNKFSNRSIHALASKPARYGTVSRAESKLTGENRSILSDAIHGQKLL